MTLARSLVLSSLALLGGACAMADEESLLIGPRPSARLEVLTPFPTIAQEGTLVLPRWQINDVSGSLARYQKYVEAPEGPFIGRLQLDGSRAGKSTLMLRLDSPGQPSSSGLLSWESIFPFSYARLSGDRYHFHLYPEAPDAVRQSLGLSAGTLLGDQATYARLQAGSSYLRLPKPDRLVNHSVDDYRLDLTRPVGRGDVDVTLGLREYRNYDGLQRGTSWATYGVRYTHNLAGLANVGAQFAFTQLSQGSRSPRVQVAALSATSPAASNLVAAAFLGSRRLSGAVEQNGYTRGTQAGRLELRYRGVRGLSLRGGYDRYEYDRVNRLQTATDEPVWHKVWASASYRPIRRWQVVARASHRSTKTPPPSGLEDPIPLSYNLDRTAEVRVEGSPMDNTGVYFTTNARFRKNTRRNIELQSDNASFGAWAQLGSRLSLNADYGLQHLDSRNFALQSALSDAWVTTVGGTYVVSSRMSLDGSYSNYRSSRAQNSRQNTYGVSLRRDIGAGASWNVEFRRDVFDDLTTPALGYAANVFSVGGSSRF